MAVPTAPIPVHTAYAEPTGSDLSETANSQTLMAIDTPVAMDGQNFVKPSEYFSPIAHPVSNSPAMIRISHALVGFI